MNETSCKWNDYLKSNFEMKLPVQSVLKLSKRVNNLFAVKI